jgi:hypothetical protein
MEWQYIAGFFQVLGSRIQTNLRLLIIYGKWLERIAWGHDMKQALITSVIFFECLKLIWWVHDIFFISLYTFLQDSNIYRIANIIYM